MDIHKRRLPAARQCTGAWIPGGAKMDGTHFDTITRRLTSVASRRHVLSGLGVATVGALLGREASAAPSPVAQCMKDCNRVAKEAREECKDEKSKAKNGCLKTVKTEHATCRNGCHLNGE
jgi:hypothetical protein